MTRARTVISKSARHRQRQQLRKQLKQQQPAPQGPTVVVCCSACGVPQQLTAVHHHHHHHNITTAAATATAHRVSSNRNRRRVPPARRNHAAFAAALQKLHSPTLLDCPPAPLHTTSMACARVAADAEAEAERAAAIASYDTAIWDVPFGGGAAAAAAAAAAGMDSSTDYNNRAAPSTAPATPEAALGLAHVPDDSADEVGWADPELEALALEFENQQHQRRLRQRAANGGTFGSSELRLAPSPVP